MVGGQTVGAKIGFWTTVMSVVTLCLINGIQYVFGLFAPEVKEALNYTQAELNLLFSALYVGSSILIFPISLFIQNIGIHVVVFFNGVIAAAMWLLIKFSVDHTIASNIGSMTVYFLLLGYALGANFLAALVVIGPDVVPGRFYVIFVGVISCSYGVGGAIFTVLYQQFFLGDLSNFLIFVAAAFFISGVWATFQVFFWRRSLEGRTVDGYETIDSSRPEKQHSHQPLPQDAETASVDGVSLYGDDMRMRTGTDLRKRQENHPHPDDPFADSAAAGASYQNGGSYQNAGSHPGSDYPTQHHETQDPFADPPDHKGREAEDPFADPAPASRDRFGDDDGDERQPLKGGSDAASVVETTQEPPKENAFRKVLRISSVILRTPAFYLLYFTMITYTGIGATYAGNIGSMVMSLGEDEHTIIDMELVFSLAQVGGRVFYTVINTIPKTPFHRSYLMFTIQVGLAVTCFVNFGVANVAVLPFAIAGIAIFYGGGWCIIATNMLFLPHPEEVGIVWGLLTSASGVGPLIVGQVVGRMYDANAPEGTIFCVGEICFKSGNLFMAILAVVAAFAGLLFRYLVRNHEPPKDSKQIVVH